VFAAEQAVEKMIAGTFVRALPFAAEQAVEK